ncbi:MAG: uridine kinase [Cytophagales bacterium]
MKKPYLIGITGGSASGKTLFINELINRFTSEEICLVSQDHYYLDREDQPKDKNGIENFDLPQSIDHKAFYKDLGELRSGKTVRRKEYTFNNPDKIPDTLTFSPAPIIVAEGLFAFYKAEYLKLYDLKLFIEASEPVKLIRRINRDNNERGYDINDVLYRYENHVYPTYEKYVKPFQSEADIIIPNHTSFEKALNVLVSHLKTFL